MRKLRKTKENHRKLIRIFRKAKASKGHSNLFLIKPKNKYYTKGTNTSVIIAKLILLFLFEKSGTDYLRPNHYLFNVFR